ncbi:hypothetical protein ACFRH6_25275 [Streptomyces sp. NPDC056749]|uniref:hypothetical protein n=1 Tax=Streptomyces sp. NPDC056749 TaxID=3345936 RepID=UPI0036AAFBA1
MTSSALPQLLRPRALRPGDLVVIASLSGPLPAAYEPNVEQTVVVSSGWDSAYAGLRYSK